MARSRKASISEQVQTALQIYTQKQLAQRLGVSERTIRRWKNHEAEPANPFVRLAVQDEYARTRRRIKTRTRREAPRSHPPDVPVPLIGERRELVRYDDRGRPTGEVYDSDWVNYQVAKLEPDLILDVLRQLRDADRTVQIIYRTPGGTPEYPRKKRAVTTPKNLRGYSDADLWNEFVQPRIIYGRVHQILWVAVVDK